MVVAAVPWARPGSRFTRAFEDLCAWLAAHASRAATAETEWSLCWPSGVGTSRSRLMMSPGSQPSVIDGLFSRPDVAYLHARDVLAGCYMFTVERAS
ncbi:helix-turn-helix domain-containing protein [Acidiferrimicrobium sp. IK]|uniref:helix-turn-helix domain-containing protein n=1 Tax=Acidiferrimicrobium sp. IK TaxID=2871700 RepID=UPI003966EB6C